jgi:hypothetical protein
MGDAGSAHGQLQRYLERGLKMQALAAAADMHRIGVEDALVLCLLLRDDPRYERAASRWHAKYVLEKGLPLAEWRPPSRSSSVAEECALPSPGSRSSPPTSGRALAGLPKGG